MAITTHESEEEYMTVGAEDKGMIIQEIRVQQNEINNIKNKCEEEVDKIEERYEEMKKPFYNKRAKLIEKIPHFWLKVFKAHSDISELITQGDEFCLEYMYNIQVNDVPAGFQIHFYFYENPFFENNLLTKEIRTDGSSKSTPIKWKPGTRLQFGDSQLSFVKWFTNQGLEDVDEFDVVSFAIKDEIWANPLRFYIDEIIIDSEEDGGATS